MAGFQLSMKRGRLSVCPGVRISGSTHDRFSFAKASETTGFNHEKALKSGENRLSVRLKAGPGSSASTAPFPEPF
jgi:hypothetical protein